MVKIQGVVQHYSWGGTQFIPQLLNAENPEQKPFAEYWLGAHPNHPSKTADGESLLHHIATQPHLLGARVLEHFGKLPFLLKVLDVAQMLSIQVHPSKEDAAKGFAEDEARGIAVNAPNRNYKDENHKPELMAALGDFWLLHGFKPEAQLEAVLQRVPELQPLLPLFRQGGYKALYEHVMQLPQATVNGLLQPLLNRVVPEYQAGRIAKESEDFWAARAALHFCKNGIIDRGIFSIYFFNLLHLKKGEGIYQPARLPHAYLEGQNVEIMANSDNVLRAGLTDKHIDVPELMKHVDFKATHPNIIAASDAQVCVYTTPAEEFELTAYSGGAVAGIASTGPEILLQLQGESRLQHGTTALVLKKGEALFVPAQAQLDLHTAAEGLLFRAAVPVYKK